MRAFRGVWGKSDPFPSKLIKISWPYLFVVAEEVRFVAQPSGIGSTDKIYEESFEGKDRLKMVFEEPVAIGH